MRRSLSEQWESFEGDGLVAPDGRRFVRRGTRTTRRVADEVVAAGGPVVVFLWSAGRLDYADGDDARACWAQLRGDFTGSPRTGGRTVQWTGGVWEDAAGERLLLLTGHC